MNSKLLTEGLITPTEHREAEESWASLGVGGGGSDPALGKIRELGEQYIRLAFQCYHYGLIDHDELADNLLLEARHLELLEDYLGPNYA